MEKQKLRKKLLEEESVFCNSSCPYDKGKECKKFLTSPERLYCPAQVEQILSLIEASGWKSPAELKGWVKPCEGEIPPSLWLALKNAEWDYIKAGWKL